MTRRRSVAWLTSGALLLASAASQLVSCNDTEQSKEEAIARGKELVRLHCCGCHGGTVTGLEHNPPNLGKISLNAKLPSGAPANDAGIRAAILEGRSGIMPSFQGTLTEEQIAEIIRYLHHVENTNDACTAN